MDDAAALLAKYQALSAVSERMLLAARAGDWDALAALQSDYAARADAVTGLALSAVPPQLAGELGALIRKLIAEETELRTLLGPQLAHLSGMLSDAGVQRKLADAYGR